CRRRGHHRGVVGRAGASRQPRAQRRLQSAPPLPVARRKNGDDGEGGQSRLQRRLPCRSGAMKIAALAAALILTASAALAGPPKADVRFVIEAQQFVGGLQSSRASVERALTQTLLDECRGQKAFPFIQWSNGDAATVNRLVVARVQRRAGGDSEILLEYRGTTKNGALPPALQEVVYRWFDAKYAAAGDVAKTRLRKTVRDQFARYTFRKALLRYFVPQVPLAENVDLDPAGHRVIVPV